MKILVINVGSGSQKVVLYDVQSQPTVQPPQFLWEGYVDWAEQQGNASIHIRTGNGASLDQEHPETDRSKMLEMLLNMLWSGPTKVVAGPAEVAMVGHRIVHGGAKLYESTRITPVVIAAINEAATIASGHNEQSLNGIEIATRFFPHASQFASFDTTFHAHLPPAETVYPVPYSWYEQGIKRYGFHGLSYQFCSERAAEMLDGNAQALRLVICHLGGGASLAAVRGGQSVATTMGFTPLEGLMMNERSGTIDPGILLYLAQQKGFTAQQLDHDLNKASGLLGVSGVSNDLRQIMKASSNGNQRAQLAWNMYILRLTQGIGAMAATLGGLDALIFTGGIGEHIAELRAQVCRSLAFMGVHIDEGVNAQATPDVDLAPQESAVRVLLLHTEEEWIIARDGWQLAQ